jgi:hypothetical protein
MDLVDRLARLPSVEAVDFLRVAGFVKEGRAKPVDQLQIEK